MRRLEFVTIARCRSKAIFSIFRRNGECVVRGRYANRGQRRTPKEVLSSLFLARAQRLRSRLAFGFTSLELRLALRLLVERFFLSSTMSYRGE